MGIPITMDGYNGINARDRSLQLDGYNGINARDRYNWMKENGFLAWKK